MSAVPGPSPLTETEYSSLAQAELKSLLAALDQLGDELEAELSSDIITVEHGRGAPFVINSHTAARQIWMAADRHAWHFDYDRDTKTWIASKSGEELWATLEGALSSKLGRPISIPHPNPSP